jgi:predicted AAA+ superfamily ATPase
MMERLMLEQFMAWKKKEICVRKPLLVTGVRQCGKTYLIRHFGEKEFEETRCSSIIRER